jgi:hypothetical protein
VPVFLSKPRKAGRLFSEADPFNLNNSVAGSNNCHVIFHGRARKFLEVC